MIDHPTTEAGGQLPPAALGADLEAAVEFCAALMRPGEVHEVRVIKRASLWADDPAVAGEYAALLERSSF
ncbi:MAG: hypothetical protein M3Q10_06155 [Chloroflexota bacterium]|nr:hypothetical protein [Chloroflexota bacterium]